MDTYHQDHTAAWNQEQMGASNPNLMGTHHQGQTGTYDTSLVGTHGHGQMHPYHQSEIGSYQPNYMNPQYATNIDDSTGNVQFIKPIKTRSNQLPRAELFPDGSQTTRPDRSAYQNPDVREKWPSLDTSKLSKKKLSRNPRTQRHPEK